MVVVGGGGGGGGRLVMEHKTMMTSDINTHE